MFSGRGLSVEVDRPFRGALVPLQFYRSDARVLAVMIEVNRGLYMDEDTGAKSPGFAATRAVLQEAMRDLIECTVEHVGTAGSGGA